MGTSAAAAPAIELTGLTKRFGAQVAVDSLDLTVPAGSFFALLGPSGCGKTTTLRMVGGFETPSEGTVRLAGEDVTARPPNHRDVNTVFQSYALFPHLDVQANVAFGLRRSKVPRDQVRQRVAEALELTELAGYERRKPAQLSGGQQQRVALARALVNRPAALLLDEPLGALDLRLRRQLQVEIKRIQQEVGITFVHVTHDQEEAMSLADEIAVMNNGRIEQRGSATELYEAPATRFVADFLGTSNLIDATVVDRRPDGVTVRTPDGAVLAVPTSRTVPGDRVLVGVRPEKVELTAPSDASADNANAVSGEVLLTTYTGLSFNHVLDLGTGSEMTVVVPNRPGVFQPAIGQVVRACWRVEDTFSLPSR